MPTHTTTYTFGGKFWEQMTIDEKYERELVKRQQELERQINAIYRAFMSEIAPLLSGTLQKKALQRAINAAITQLTRNVKAEVVSGIRHSWELSHLKNVAYLDRRLAKLPAGLEIPDNVRAVWYDPNKPALTEFLKRERNGLNLSKRIHKQTAIARRGIKKVLKEGIGEGKSAVKIARKLRDTLKEPGSNAVANTMRVARTETNMAYRRADHEAWIKDPAILGFEIHLSNTQSKKVKARCEICKKLVGKYPVTFIFVGWHPSCLCYETPIEMTDAQFARFMRLVGQGTDTKEAVEEVRKSARLVTDVPDQFKKWVTANEKRVKGWSQRPYWWGDNLKVVKDILK